jgi:hypothetical protein
MIQDILTEFKKNDQSQRRGKKHDFNQEITQTELKIKEVDSCLKENVLPVFINAQNDLIELKYCNKLELREISYSKSEDKYLVEIILYFFPEIFDRNLSLNQAQLDRLYNINFSASSNFSQIVFSIKLGNKKDFQILDFSVPKIYKVADIKRPDVKFLMRWFINKSLEHYKTSYTECPFNLFLSGFCVGEIKQP